MIRYGCIYLSIIAVFCFTMRAYAVGTLVGRVVDDATGRILPARIYITAADGKTYLPQARQGEMVGVYKKIRAVAEHYACIGAHPFSLDLPAGKCLVEVFHGKEYAPIKTEINIAEGEKIEQTFSLHRHFNMADKGWYSGDLHVHTPLSDLPAFQLAEDLNITFPLTAWARDSREVPRNQGGKVPAKGELVTIDDTHVYWNLNTEYEIFSLAGVRGKQGYGENVQGAILILGHQKPFTQTAPPIGPIAAEARKQGAILDWDKHNWPWSTMIVPVTGIETMELSNNHMWPKAPCPLADWGESAPDWINRTLDNRGWAEFGFQVYYALLNCGFCIHPSAGTANGVHPVPLGFSRVYVNIAGPFSYEKWVAGLKKGRSFATNGPMLFLTADKLLPGDRKTIEPGLTVKVKVDVEAQSVNELQSIELIVNGKVAHSFDCTRITGDRRHCRFNADLQIAGTSWIAARCFEVPPKDNIRFAHTGAVFFEDTTKPLLPERRQVEYFIDSLHRAVERYGQKLSPQALDEYRKALEAFRSAAKTGLVPKNTP